MVMATPGTVMTYNSMDTTPMVMDTTASTSGTVMTYNPMDTTPMVVDTTPGDTTQPLPATDTTSVVTLPPPGTLGTGGPPILGTLGTLPPPGTVGTPPSFPGTGCPPRPPFHPSPGDPPPLPCGGIPIWGIDWSINSDFDSVNPSGNHLDDYQYKLSLSGSILPGTLEVDPIHGNVTAGLRPAIGNNMTPNGGAGMSTMDQNAYMTIIASNNVAQNSWAYFSFPAPGAPPLVPNPQPGTWTSTPEAIDPTTDGVVASVSIDVIISGGVVMMYP